MVKTIFNVNSLTTGNNKIMISYAQTTQTNSLLYLKDIMHDTQRSAFPTYVPIDTQVP